MPARTTRASSDPSAKKGESAKLVEISPLTGQAMPNGRPDNPVFVVKIENTDGGAPQYGLDKADMVLEELVEGGLTRLAAFYYSDAADQGRPRALAAHHRHRHRQAGRRQDRRLGRRHGAVRQDQRTPASRVFSEDAGSRLQPRPAKARPYNRLINLKTRRARRPS